MAPMAAAGVMAGLSAITGLIQSQQNRKLANDQMDRQGQLRKEADNLKAPDVAKSFLEAERMREVAAMRGLPGLKNYEEGLAAGTADLAAKGKQAAQSGGDYLAYLSGLYGNQLKATNNLYASDANYRATQFDALIGQKNAIAGQEARNQDIKRAQQDELYKQANDLETAATENKVMADKQIMDSVSGLAKAGVMGGIGTGGGGDYKSFFDQPKVDNMQTQGISSLPTTDIKDAPINTLGYTNSAGTFLSQPEQGGIQNILQEMDLKPTGTFSDIKAAQSYLKGAGYYDGLIDGLYGPKSTKAMMDWLQFQQQQNIPQDMNYYYNMSMLRPR